MKAVYYLVTGLAALTVLAYAGWQTYLHVKMGVVPGLVAPAQCSCSPDCDCGASCDCAKQEKKCNPNCKCR